ncbi:NAD-dependent epimerase/dehydratase family protein [Rhodococcoides fascians]|uniref:NAD-dependent epimerase/dehydratase family protein n=1 Tax=Rhodococcoides fascians TaxID=1828 RepID=UPI0009B895CC|nr:NAD-dependent epimerase/dehydratase family protein [Rhodococcus fascians]
MTSLVTGAAGFIGSAICERLLANGEDVVGIDCFTNYYDRSIKDRNLTRLLPHQKFTFVESDLLTLDLNAQLSGIDHLYHQAGQPGVRKSWGSDFAEYTRANIAVTQRLLEAALNNNLDKFVYASSSSIYGNAGSYPTSEDSIAQPLSPYGVTKLAAEHLCTLYAKNYGLPTVSLRYFTVYGPGQRPDMAFTKFCNQILENAPVPLYGTGAQIRDFTYVDDVVSANLAAAGTRTQPGSIYNVAGGSNASMLDVLDIFGRVSGGRVAINQSEAVAGDVTRTGGDTTKIRRDLDWKPTIELEDGLGRQFAWARSVLHGNESL